MNEWPKRKMNRLRGYNYGQSGMCFITICAKERLCLFSEIVEAEIDCSLMCQPNEPQIKLTPIGQTIREAIRNIPQTCNSCGVDSFVIMPNHVHLILLFSENHEQAMNTMNVSSLIGKMKRFVSLKIGYSVWQKSFYDHIIRSEDDYLRIAQYVLDNPSRWLNDS
jgi:REP element-mobilizing transposase RayT